MKYDAIVVGGGIAGLTSTAFLTKNGYKTLLCEKEDHVGGLVSSFTVDGFLFDGGVRGIVDSGIVKPMLKQLGIELEFIKNIVSIGVEDEIVQVKTIESLEDYQAMLVRTYPDNEKDIRNILNEMKKVMGFMDVLYGIENPLFKDLKNDREYLFKTLIPWTFKFMTKIGKLKNFSAPVYEFLGRFTDNQSLIDFIAQHFFQETPASFALSYFSLYLDYEYPANGTYELIEKIRDYIIQAGGHIKTSTEIEKIDFINKTIVDGSDQEYQYEQLVWAADQKRLYDSIDMDALSESQVKNNIEERIELLRDKRGGDSIYSLFLLVDLDKDYFSKIGSGHLFYTPNKFGQSAIFSKLDDITKSTDKQEIIAWMDELLEFTTYEIAIPSLRNENLAPLGKTGVIVSTLMDYRFIDNVKSLGFYEEFKDFCEQKIISVLDKSIYKGLQEKVIKRFSSTPLTIERLSGNFEGGITGWAFTNKVVPAISKNTEINKACLTPIPDVLQAGQWTFSPSGLPISILTGKMAADQAEKNLEKMKK